MSFTIQLETDINWWIHAPRHLWVFHWTHHDRWRADTKLHTYGSVMKEISKRWCIQKFSIHMESMLLMLTVWDSICDSRGEFSMKRSNDSYRWHPVLPTVNLCGPMILRLSCTRLHIEYYSNIASVEWTHQNHCHCKRIVCRFPAGKSSLDRLEQFECHST